MAQHDLGGLAGDYTISNRVGMPLVRIARGADTALELNTAALLNDMRGHVRDGVQIGPATRTT